MSYDDLLKPTAIGALSIQVNQLQQQRDELLAALQIALPYVEAADSETAPILKAEALQQIRAAIAKVTK